MIRRREAFLMLITGARAEGPIVRGVWLVSSLAREELLNRLDDVEELVSAHSVLTGGGRGRPRERQGAALTRAGVVLLAAAMEAYVEELFEESARRVFANWPEPDVDAFVEQTAGRLNNADAKKTGMLFFNIGVP